MIGGQHPAINIVDSDNSGDTGFHQSVEQNNGTFGFVKEALILGIGFETPETAV
jgi:hypothetical protein